MESWLYSITNILKWIQLKIYYLFCWNTDFASLTQWVSRFKILNIPSRFRSDTAWSHIAFYHKIKNIYYVIKQQLTHLASGLQIFTHCVRSFVHKTKSLYNVKAGARWVILNWLDLFTDKARPTVVGGH